MFASGLVYLDLLLLILETNVTINYEKEERHGCLFLCFQFPGHLCLTG